MNACEFVIKNMEESILPIMLEYDSNQTGR